MKNQNSFYQYASYKSDISIERERQEAIAMKERERQEYIVAKKYHEFKRRQNNEMKNRLCEKCKNLPKELSEAMHYCSRAPKWSEIKLCEKCKEMLNKSWKDWRNEYIQL